MEVDKNKSLLAEAATSIAKDLKSTPKKQARKQSSDLSEKLLATPPMIRRKAKIEYKKEEQEVHDQNPIELAPSSGKKRQRTRSPSANKRRLSKLANSSNSIYRIGGSSSRLPAA